MKKAFPRSCSHLSRMYCVMGLCLCIGSFTLAAGETSIEGILNNLKQADRASFRILTSKPDLQHALTITRGEHKPDQPRLGVMEFLVENTLVLEPTAHAAVDVKIGDALSYTLYARGSAEAAMLVRVACPPEKFEQWKKVHIPKSRVLLRNDDDWYVRYFRKSQDNPHRILTEVQQASVLKLAKQEYESVRTEVNALLTSYLFAKPAEEMHWQGYEFVNENRWVMCTGGSDRMFFWRLIIEIDPQTKKPGAIYLSELFKGE